MSDLTLLALARVVHVLAVVLWIGGVAMVTLVILPHVRRDGGTLAEFEAIERRFSLQVKFIVAAAGLSGFYMTWGLGLWSRFEDARFWWMHAMLIVWAVFSLVLYVLEPLFLHRWFRRRSVADPAGTVALVLGMHRVLLAASLLAVAGAVAGSHGLM